MRRRRKGITIIKDQMEEERYRIERLRPSLARPSKSKVHLRFSFVLHLESFDARGISVKYHPSYWASSFAFVQFGNWKGRDGLLCAVSAKRASARTHSFAVL